MKPQRYSISSIVFITAILPFLASCSTIGDATRVSVSNRMGSPSSMRIIAMPFTVEGNPEIQLDEQASAEIAAAFLDRGCTVIDSRATAAQAKAIGLDITKEMSSADMQKLAHAMNANAILVGTTAYSLAPEADWTDPVVSRPDTNGKGRRIGTSVSGGGSHHVAAHYNTAGVTARLLSASDFEVLLSARVSSGPYMSLDMAAAIRKRM